MTGEIDHRIHNGGVMISKKDDRSLEEKQVRREGREDLIARVSGVSFAYPDDPARPVLRGLDLGIARGECLAVLGESGSGKTTLLKLLCGLLMPTEGTILFEGEPLGGPRSDIALIFQNYGLFPWKTVRENILLPAELRGEAKKEEPRLEDLLEYLRLSEHARKYPAELSGGQRQRTALGRAVMSRASLLLMDEPFSALDLRNRVRLQAFMKQFLEDTGMTSVIVTHSIEEALRMGDRVAVFDEKEGRISEILAGFRREKDLQGSEYEARAGRLRQRLLS